MMAVKRYAEAEKERCAACGACRKECPRGAISIWKGCYAQIDKTMCVGCGMCEKVCPAGCITIREWGQEV